MEGDHTDLGSCGCWRVGICCAGRLVGGCAWEHDFWLYRKHVERRNPWLASGRQLQYYCPRKVDLPAVEPSRSAPAVLRVGRDSWCCGAVLSAYLLVAPQALLENLFEKRDKALDSTTRVTGLLIRVLEPVLELLVGSERDLSEPETPSGVRKCLLSRFRSDSLSGHFLRVLAEKPRRGERFGCPKRDGAPVLSSKRNPKLEIPFAEFLVFEQVLKQRLRRDLPRGLF